MDAQCTDGVLLDHLPTYRCFCWVEENKRERPRDREHLGLRARARMRLRGQFKSSRDVFQTGQSTHLSKPLETTDKIAQSQRMSGRSFVRNT